MNTPKGYRLINVDEEHLPAFGEVAAWAFSSEWKDEDKAFYLSVIPPSQAYAVQVADPSRGSVGEFAGVRSSYDMELAVPAGLGATGPLRVSAAGLTWVGVHPAHRRRGILRSMITDHLEKSVAAGHAVAALYAAETEIYTRFGYGLAAIHLGVKIERGAGLRDVPGSNDLAVRIERADREVHMDAVLSVLEQEIRPGTIVPPVGEGRIALFGDPEDERDDAEKWRILIVEDAGTPVGFAFFRRTSEWGQGFPDGTLFVEMHHALTPAAHHRMWSVLLDIDLMSKTHCSPLPTDDPLLWMLTDPRGAKPDSHDNIFVRILDVKKALEGRRYYADGHFGIIVNDVMLPANAATWELSITDGVGTVNRWERDVRPDIRIDIRDLGAAYLGGVGIDTLTAAGHIEEVTPGAAAKIALAFRSLDAPMASWDF